MPITQILLTAATVNGPTYTLTPAANDVNEGSELTFTVGGTNISDGTYYWTIETNAGDFATTSGEVVVTSNSGTFGVTPTADTTTEDPAVDTFTVALRSVSTSGTILVTSSAVTINDTSLSAPTYTITALGSQASATSVDEGSSATFEVGGTNIIDGTYYWTIETNAEDFATASGSFSITSNTGSFSVVPTEDTTTEGEQTFTVAVRSVSTTGTVLVTSDPFTINDTSFAIGGQYTFNGTPTSWATTNATVNTYGAYTYPDESSGSLHTLTGSEFLMSGDIGNNTVLNINLWFYPTANNLVIMGEMGQPAENDSWHYSMLDIDNTNHLKGRLWEFAGVTSTGTVTLNAWNHAYLYYNSVNDSIGLSLNNETAVTTATGDRHPSDTSETYLGIGIVDNQNMSSSTRYQGKFDGLVIDTTLTGSNYSSTKAKYLPPLSLVFNKSQSDYLSTPGNADWNLGTTWTMEFWINANSSGYSGNPNMNGDIWGLLNQGGWATTNSINIAISDAKLVVGQGPETSDVRYTEPTPNGVPSGVTAVTASTGNWESNPLSNLATTGGTGTGLRVNVSYTGGYASTITIATAGSGYTNGETIVVDSGTSSAQFTISVNSPVVWTHVAIVNNAGTQKVYYNGVEQTKVSGTFGTANYANGTDTLAIGNTSGGNNYFDGKLAMVRISNTAKYLAPFIPTTTYGVDANTKLFLGSVNPLVDSMSHTVTNNGVTTSTDVPVIIPATITITNVSVGFNSKAATVDFTSTVSQAETASIFFEWFGGAGYSGPYTLTVNPGVNTYTSPMLGLSGSGSDLTTEITIDSGLNGCTSNIYTGAWSVVCLVEGTMVTMADGSHKAIEDIGYDDLIRVWNFDLGEFSEALPVFVKQEETHSEHYRFTFSDGTVLRTVGHHVFNKQAGAFTMLVRDTTPVGTITFNELGEEVTLISKETIEESVRFYNVWTQYHLNLFADSILTSNRFNNIYPIQDMKFVKDNRALRPLEEFANIDPKYISGLRLQEQPAQYTAEYIRDYVENKLERLDIANTVNYVHTE